MAIESTLQTRRKMLNTSAVGFGHLALSALLSQDSSADQPSPTAPRDPLEPKPRHLPARAKRIVFLFMKGGPSHVDPFDPNPLLTRDNGNPPPFRPP